VTVVAVHSDHTTSYDERFAALLHVCGVPRLNRDLKVRH
jgi:hypothetical protein